MNIKHILTLAASISAAVANAFTYDRYPWPEPEMLTAVSNITSQCEAVNAMKTHILSGRQNYSSITYTPVFSNFSVSDIAEIDRVFGNIGWVIASSDKMPICTSNYIEHIACKTYHGPESEAAAYKAILQKYNTADLGLVLGKADFEDTVKLFNAVYRSEQIHTFKRWQSEIQRKYLKKVKKHLRDTGVSFVTKGDVNPVEPYMTALVATLNAPCLNGLEAAFEAVGEPFTLDTSILMTENDASEIADKILDGEIDIKPTLKFRLFIALGVERYNDFVREYNGD